MVLSVICRCHTVFPLHVCVQYISETLFKKQYYATRKRGGATWIPLKDLKKVIRLNQLSLPRQETGKEASVQVVGSKIVGETEPIHW